MTTKLSNYLRMYRKRRGLSQSELAFLLGCRSGAKVSRYERHARMPSLETVFAYEVIFGVPARELFAGTYQQAEHRIHERAKLLADKLDHAPSTPAVKYKRASIERITSLAPTSPQKAPGRGDRGTRIVALDPTSHGFGFVVFEGPTTLVDWGHTHVRPCAHEKCLEQIAELIARYAPQIVVTEDWESEEFGNLSEARVAV